MGLLKSLNRRLRRSLRNGLMVDDSISGIVTASDYSVTEGDTVTLTFEDTSIDVPGNVYQWIDDNGDNISGETTAETDWVASLSEQPPRIRVSNAGLAKTKVFRVSGLVVSPIVTPSNALSYQSEVLLYNNQELTYAGD